MAKALRTAGPFWSPRPLNNVLPTITGTLTVGQILTCNPGSWYGRNLTFTYQWIRDVSTNIAGATNATYTLVAGDSTHTIKCQVTATAADTNLGAKTATTAPTATVP